MESAKRKSIAQNLKFKYVVLSIEFSLSSLACYIMKNEKINKKSVSSIEL